MRPVRITLVFCLVFLTARTARAGGFTLTGFGARREGMFAVMGRPDDLTAIFHNPAGLSDQPGVRMHFSFLPGILQNWFKLRALDPVRFPEINPEGCGEPGNDPCPWPIGPEGNYRGRIKPTRAYGLLPFVAASTDFGWAHKSLKNLVAGLAFYLPNFYGAFLPENAPTAYHVIGGYFLVGTLTAAVGYRINRYVAVGGSISYNYMRLQLAQKMSVIDALTPEGEVPSSTAEVAQGLIGDLRMDYEGEDHGAGWGLSFLVTPVRWFSFGVTYLGATQAAFEGPVRFRGLSDLAREDPDLLGAALRTAGYKLPQKLQIRFPIPHSLNFGVSFRVGRYVELGMDSRIWFYNFYREQVLIPIYDPSEPGDEPMTREDLTRRKDYKISWQLGGGILFRPVKKHPGFEAMLGLGYDASPIPDHTFTLDNPSLSHFKVSGGVRWQINKTFRVAATYLISIYLERHITNSQTSPPANGRGGGLAHSPGIELEVHL